MPENKAEEIHAIVSECVQKLYLAMEWDLEPGLAEDAANRLGQLEAKCGRYESALKLIALRDYTALVDWATRTKALDAENYTVLKQGYKPDYKDGFAYRGALVLVQREIARRALQV